MSYFLLLSLFSPFKRCELHIQIQEIKPIISAVSVAMHLLHTDPVLNKPINEMK